MEALSTTANDMLRRLLAAQPTTAAKVGFAWKIVAGRALARAARTEWRDDGVLTVRAESDVWRKELRRARPVLFRRLTELLGPEVVTKLIIQ